MPTRLFVLSGPCKICWFNEVPLNCPAQSKTTQNFVHSDEVHTRPYIDHFHFDLAPQWHDPERSYPKFYLCTYQTTPDLQLNACPKIEDVTTPCYNCLEDEDNFSSKGYQFGNGCQLRCMTFS